MKASPLGQNMRSNDYRRLSETAEKITNRYDLLSEMVEAWHSDGMVDCLGRKTIDSFPAAEQESYTFDELVESVVGMCKTAAAERYSSLMFNLDYEEIGDLSGETDKNGNPYIDCFYYVNEEKRSRVPVEWNHLNSPHLAAELATTLIKRGIWCSFPFEEGRAWYEASWLESDEREALEKLLVTPGGYEAYKQGVPVSDIVA